jgi:hypothetical protein
LKKKSNFGKKKEKEKEKKGESWEKMTKCQKKKTLWITVVIHNILCVGE